MVTHDATFARSHGAGESWFAPFSAERLYILGGIALATAGMIYGVLFAIFVLHQNAGRIGEHLLAVTQAVAAGDPAGATSHFSSIGNLLENRGTKVDAHVHILDFGFLALLMALVQPCVALAAKTKIRLAQTFLAGAVLLPVSVFLIHYAGVAYSPFEYIGWASITADFGGLLVIIAAAGVLVGLWQRFGEAGVDEAKETLQPDRSWAARALMAGGTGLVMLGFLHGAFYSTVDLYAHEAQDPRLLRTMYESAAENRLTQAAGAVNAYGALLGNKAVKIATHSHIIEFGFLALLLAFVQRYIFLSERWKRRWAITLLLGGVILPVFVLLELRWGLVAGGMADFGGFLVIVALSGMFVGVLRQTGRLDAPQKDAQ